MANPNNLAAVLQEHINTILQAYDKDKNSSLDKDELRNLLADNLGVPATEISQDQLDWHFNRIDTDGDGKITFIEYFEHFFLKRAKQTRDKIKKETASKKEEGQGQGQGQGEAKGKPNGQDEDQLIDIDQFRKLIQDTFKGIKVTITEEMVQWNFNQIDKDNSGRISFEEFLNFIKKYNS